MKESEQPSARHCHFGLFQLYCIMRKLIPVLLVLVAFVFSCKKEEPEIQPYQWNEDWACFTGTFISYSGDTSYIGFSSNQGADCFADCWTIQSLMPWEDEARYSSSVDGFYKVEVKKGVLNFNGTNWDDVPADEDFISYFRSGFDTLVLDDLDYQPGVEIIFTDEDGWGFSSADYTNYGNQNYTCRITDYHPFVRNGIQYVKVKMFFDGIYVENVMGDWYLLKNCEYEGYFKND